MKKLIFASLLMVASLVNAENITEIFKKEEAPKFGIAIVPQYAIMSGMRMDADILLGEKQYLTLAPQLYYSNSSYMYSYDETSFVGGGLKLTYRYFPGKKAKGDGGYLGLGLDYKYMDFKYDTYSYYDYTEDGVEYSTVTDKEGNKIFNQAGFDITLGYQLKVTPEFYLDFYAGWGFRLSDFDPDSDDDEEEWGYGILDPGYSGFIPMAGVRIGLFLK